MSARGNFRGSYGGGQYPALQQAPATNSLKVLIAGATEALPVADTEGTAWVPVEVAAGAGSKAGIGDPVAAAPAPELLLVSLMSRAQDAQPLEQDQ
ncbi:hypothetical protein VMCG_02840 [Cytospora schulzeri]|uniref:Uncharacterized protein n=1 Tax=Cytospora schulzeri TaxID=448051 RepID=A0A423WZU7_9PEZI|nr:hypothetical protein VMCG_02840 [Valsa malicola]